MSAIAAPTAPNHKKRWTIEDDVELVKCRYSSSYEEMADKLQRTVDAVKARFVKKYIVPKYNKNFLCENTKFVANLYKIDKNDFVRYLKYAGTKAEYQEDDEEDDIAETDDDTSSSEYQPEDDNESNDDEDDDDEDDDDEDDDNDDYDEYDDDEVELQNNNSFKIKFDLELNMLHIAIITAGSMALYYMYPLIIRSI